jgi:hypothetical protein
LQVVKAALLTDVHDSGDVDATAPELESLLGDTLDTAAWEEAAQAFSHSGREVVHSNGSLEVVDSLIDGQWQRYAVRPGAVQRTCVCSVFMSAFGKIGLQ